MLSASDIETYRTCPLKYKFARVFRIPSEPTMNQRFGIAVHQVLERYHRLEDGDAAGEQEILGLLEAAWRAWRVRQLRRGAPAARQGDRRPAPLPPAVHLRGRRAGVVREGLPVPHGPAHAARPRRPRRPPARRRLRAHRLQDRAPEDGGPAARRRAALAVRGRGARGVAARRVAPELPLRARRREGSPSPPTRSTATGSPRPCSPWPRGSPARASSRPRPTGRARCATSASPARRRSASRRLQLRVP